MTTAIVLAGGPRDELAATQPGAANKAFIEIAEKTLLERTITALRSSDCINRIIVVAPPATTDHPAVLMADEHRPDGKKISESLANGLRNLPPDDLTIVATSDLPILTPESVTDFVTRATTADADIGYGCLEKRIHIAAFPQIPHTWARLKDGTYCGGGLMSIKPRILPSLDHFIEQLGAARKNPLHLASIFGWNILLRFALGRLTIAQAETRASQLLDARARAIISPYAETAVNVDRLSDIPLAEDLVGMRERKTVAGG